MILTFKKTFLATISALLVSYFFLELFNFKEKIITIQKNQVSITSQIVILTGGTNRIKKGFEIINNIDDYLHTLIESYRIFASDRDNITYDYQGNDQKFLGTDSEYIKE